MARIELAGPSLLYPRKKRDAAKAFHRAESGIVHGLLGGSLKLLFEKKRARLAGLALLSERNYSAA